MTRNLLFSAVLPACILFQLATSPTPVFGEALFGVIGGVARDFTSGQPAAQVRVTAHNVQKGTDSVAISGSDGSFTISRLEPGLYQVVAAREGYITSTASVEMAAPQNKRLEILLAALGTPTPEGKASPATAYESGSTVTNEALMKRIEQLEATIQALSAATPLSATKAVMPAPVVQPGAPVAAPNPAPAAQAAANSPAPQASAAPAVDMATPFADYDWTWLNGNSRQHDSPLDSKYFSGEFRADTHYGIDFNQPIDHSMGGSSEVFRSGEIQLEDLSIGGDFHAGNMRGRVLALFGLFSTTTPRNDASAAVGQWDVRNAYRYVSEAYGGYHFNVNHGLNVDAGIFVSYVGLFSYHNFDNWAYQPSYVSSNTPWFFNGVRVQWFPTHHLKIEPWFINGWQSYNKFNGHPGIGGQLKWTPFPWLDVIANQYAVGNDNIGLPRRGRYHTDDSVEVKYYDKPENTLDRMAFTFTGDMGCETGQGVTCHGGKGPYDPVTGKGGPKQSFLGYMLYNRFWFKKDLFGLTLGGGQINNPGRYLTLVLPVNGADAISGTPYFPATPGSSFKAYDATATFDWMPSQFTTFRMEFGYRHSNVPYWSGRGGITPPGGNNGSPANFVCSSGATSGQTDLSAAEAACGGGRSSVWFPDLRKGQALLMFSVMVKL
jgi:hypothetical protein